MLLLSLPQGNIEVSVIVRSTARPTLADALASLGLQHGVAIEVLVVAACGGTHPPLPSSCGPHPLRLVTSDVPLGRAAAANAGLAGASGDAITFLDDDDAFKPGHVAGLLTFMRSTPGCRVVHSYADAIFSDGHRERFGHPFSLIQLYERNYIHLSTTLFSRDLVLAGCRFDEALEIHEDWDFLLQLAQHTPFEFAPAQTFQWHVELGTSGAGGGANQDAPRFAEFRDRIYAKWTHQREALFDRVTALLNEAAAHARNGQTATAEESIRAALALSPNDPYALNLSAMIQRQAGRLVEARSAQEMAVAVRPDDPSMLYNLALVAIAQRDAAFARGCCERALALEPGYPPAERLRRQLVN
jgi:hypothetical protein